MTREAPLPVVVRLLHLPDCPLAERVRGTLRECLPGAGVPVRVEEVEGSFPSPTVLADGVDVVTGSAPSPGPCCRLDLPTAAQILAAVRRCAATAAISPGRQRIRLTAPPGRRKPRPAERLAGGSPVLPAEGQGRASRMRFIGVSAARRIRLNPASWSTWRSRASPAWAPRPSATSWDSELGVQIAADTV